MFFLDNKSYISSLHDNEMGGGNIRIHAVQYSMAI